MVNRGKRITLRLNKKNFSLIIFAILFFLFAIFDQTNSRQNYVFNANRSRAHLALILLDVYMSIYLILNLKYFRRVDTSGLLLMGIAGWIFLTDRINGVPLSSSMVRQAMAIAWALVYFFFSIYCGQNDNNEIELKRFSVYQYLLFTSIFLYYSFTILSQWNRRQVLQCIMNIVVLMPWFTILFKKEKNLNRLLIISAALAFLSFKRSAMIAIIAMATIVFFSGKKNSAKRVVWLVVGVITVVILFAVVDRWSGGYLSGRFQGENIVTGGGRIYIYQMGVRDLKARSIGSLIIGKGSSAANSIIGTGLHNDWLEFWFSYGIIGEILYIALIVSFLKKIHYSVSPRHKLSAKMMLAFFVTLSLLSTAYFAYVAFQIFGFYGILEFNNKKYGDIQA